MNGLILTTFCILTITKLGYPRILSNIPNCKHFDDSQNLCLQCNEGYKLNWEQDKCVQWLSVFDKNCKQMSPFSDCIRCDCGFVYNTQDEKCYLITQPKLIGCLTQSQKDNCTRPKELFSLNYVGEVFYSKGSNCELVNEENVCIQCHSQYILQSDGTCLKSQTKILNGYFSYFINDRLKSRDNRFQVGINGVFPMIQNCQIIQEIPNDFKGKCTQCFNQFVPNQSQSQCFTQPCLFCKFVSDIDPYLCVECQNSDLFYLYTDPITKKQGCIPRSVAYEEDGCLIRNQKYDFCIQCKKNLFLISGKCYLESNPIISQTEIQQNLLIGCLNFIDDQICQECNSNFLLSNGKCFEQKIPGCEEVDMSGNCTKCQSLYYLDQINQSCQFITPTLACRDSDGISNKCSLCGSLYYVDNSGNCQKIDDQNYCSMSDGIKNECQTCNNLYYPQANLSGIIQCSKITQYSQCIVSNGVNDECTVCSYLYERVKLPTGGYTCQGNNQLIYIDPLDGKTKCSYQYYYYDTASASCIQYSFQNANKCVIFDKQANKCQKCLSKLYIRPSDQSCQIVSASQPCANSDGVNNFCLKCNLNIQYVSPDGQVCLNGSPDCITNNVLNTCTYCYEQNQLGIYTTDQRTTPPTVFCNIQGLSNDYRCLLGEITNVINFSCQLCQNLFYINANYKCVPITTQYCELSDGKNDKCLLCTDKYILDPTTNICNPIIIQYCINQILDKCQECQNLFYLNITNSECLPITNPNCLNSDGKQNLCLKCKPQYDSQDAMYLNFCGYAFCDQVDYTQKICISCTQGYFLLEGKCRKITIENCEDQFSLNYCNKCKNMYYKEYSPFIQSDVCRSINILNCIKNEVDSKICSECQTGYYLSDTKMKCLSIKNCLKVNQTQKICEQCQSSSFLSEDQKYCKQVPDCVIRQGNKCQNCKEGFYLANSSCIRIPYCQKSDGINRFCQQCINGYHLVNGICIVANLIENCIEYDQFNKCIQCQNLFYLFTPNNCQPIQKINCELSDGINQACIRCSTFGYVFGSSQNCIQIQNCIFSNGKDLCLTCNQGYYLSQQIINSCVIQSNIVDCVRYQQDRIGCQKCVSTKFPSPDKLQCLNVQDTKLQNCIFTDGMLDQCLVCELSFVLTEKYDQKTKKIGNYCIKRSNFLPHIQQGCLKYNSNGSCSLCFQPYFLNMKSICVPRKQIDNCKKYDIIQDSCLECNSGFQLRVNKFYSSIKQCYQLQPNQIIANCQNYDQATGQCVNCINNYQNHYFPIQEYYFDTLNNLCKNISKKLCQTYDQSQSDCSFKFVLNCEVYDKNLQNCIQCENKFYLSNGICIPHPSIQSCIQYSNQIGGICNLCENLFYLSSNSLACQSVAIPQCQISIPNKNLCSRCTQNFSRSLDQSKCIQTNIPNCLIADDKQKCKQCYDDYIISEDSTQCFNPLISDPNCLVAFANSKCKLCKQNYTLNDQNNCINQSNPCMSDKCLQISPQSSEDKFYCSKCIQGYQLLMDGSCTVIQLESQQQQFIRENSEGLSLKYILIIIFIVCLIIAFLLIVTFYLFNRRRQKLKKKAKIYTTENNKLKFGLEESFSKQINQKVKFLEKNLQSLKDIDVINEQNGVNNIDKQQLEQQDDPQNSKSFNKVINIDLQEINNKDDN